MQLAKDCILSRPLLSHCTPPPLLHHLTEEKEKVAVRRAKNLVPISSFHNTFS